MNDRKTLPSCHYRSDSISLIIVDNFYSDPAAIRALALRQTYVDYVPGAKSDGAWRSTSLLRYEGAPVKNPFVGFRYAPLELLSQCEAIVQQPIDRSSWATSGDGWNGVFHLLSDEWSGESASIHHHCKPGDVFPYGWSAIVYLSPAPTKASGTTIWREKNSGSCTGKTDVVFYKGEDKSNFEPYLSIDNVFNRLVLFRESVWHSAGSGFGETKQDARLTQTLFFRTKW